MADFYFPAFDEFDLDDDERSVCEYFMRLQCMFERAQDDFGYVFATWRELNEIREAISEEFAAMAKGALENRIIRPPSGPGDHPTIEAVMIHTPGLSMGELREQSALLRAESAAGSLILMVDDAIQRLRHTVWDAKAKSPYPSDFTLGKLDAGRGHVATAIWAAGNAYRHSKDWEGMVDTNGNIDTKHPNYAASVRTFAILEPLVGLDKIGKDCVCVATLEVVSSFRRNKPSMEALWDGALTAVGHEFAETYCEDEDAQQRIDDALRYLHDYNNFEISFSGNSKLYRTDDDDD